MLIPKTASEEKAEMEAQCAALAADGGLPRVRRMIDGGDPLTPEDIQVAEAWLAAKEREANEEWLRTPEGSAVRQADAAERAADAAYKSARWAGWAIAISLAALALSAWTFLREP